MITSANAFEFKANKLRSAWNSKAVVCSRQSHAIRNKTLSKGIIKLKNYADKPLKARTG